MKNFKSDSLHAQVPMKVTDDVIRDFDIDHSKVKTMRIGNLNCKVAMVDADADVYNAYMQPEWKETKRAERENRCMVRGKSGRLIQCPESNSCENCPYRDKKQILGSKPVSLDLLDETETAPYATESVEEDTVCNILLEQLITLLNRIDNRYGIIFQMLYDGATQQEIADAIGIPQRTVSDNVKKIRKIVQRHVGDDLKG